MRSERTEKQKQKKEELVLSTSRFPHSGNQKDKYKNKKYIFEQVFKKTEKASKLFFLLHPQNK